jgi:hypothetical protein
MNREPRGNGKFGVVVFLLCFGLLATLRLSAAPAPITLAIFDFELEDFSASAPSAGVALSDAEHLANVTETVRQLFAQSGRYRLIDVDSVKARTLRDCDECDAEIA